MPDNTLIEAFNGRFRAERLNVHRFMSLADAQEKVETLAEIVDIELQYARSGQNSRSQ